MPGPLLFGDPPLSMIILLLIALVGAVALAAGYGLGCARDRSRYAVVATRAATSAANHDQAELLRSIVELQTEWITHYQPDLTLSFVNEAFARHTGMPAEDIIGCPVSKLIADGDLERFRQQLAS